VKIFVDSFQFAGKILPKNHRIKMLGIFVLSFVNSLIDLLGIGAILPILVVLLESNATEKYNWALYIHDTLNLDNENQLVIILTLFFFLAIFFKNIIGLFITKIQYAYSLRLNKLFLLRLHKYYYKKGFVFFKSKNSNEIATHLKLATERFCEAFIIGNLGIINDLIALVIITISLLFYNFKILILLLLTVLPFAVLFYYAVKNKSIKLGNIRMKNEASLTKNIYQSLFGYVDVIVSGSEHVFRNQMSQNLDVRVKINSKEHVYNIAPGRVIETSIMLAVAIIIFYGIYFLPTREDLVKILGLFVVAGYKIMPTTNRIMMRLNNLNINLWVKSILSPLEFWSDSTNVVQKELNFERFLSLESVCFKYDTGQKNILDNISFKVKKGEFIGLVGPSGSGKTTLLNIMLGFLTPTKGSYKIDGVEFNESFNDSFYKEIGYVQQRVYLIDGTIEDNVVLGYDKEHIDYEKLERVLRQASLWEYISMLTDGTKTLIGENGARLSGGQQQRLGIARALYFDAEILFFDEATSSLDAKTEKEITDTIRKLSNGSYTIIMISHKSSTLSDCNRIIDLGLI